MISSKYQTIGLYIDSWLPSNTDGTKCHSISHDMGGKYWFEIEGHGPPFYLGCPKCQGTMVNQSAYCGLPFDIKAGPNQAN